MNATLQLDGNLLLTGKGQTQVIRPDHRAYGQLMRLYQNATVALAATHAPAGYTADSPLMIQSHAYIGGQFIPADVVADATPAEKRELKEGQAAEAEAKGEPEHQPPPGYGGHPWKSGTPEYGTVYHAPLADLHVDPKRFRHKPQNVRGMTYNPDFGGVLAVWKDPKDGKTYVVTGQGRHGLAENAGADTVAVRYLKAKNATEARAAGAIINIAGGKGTAEDAKQLQSAGAKADDLTSRGVVFQGSLFGDDEPDIGKKDADAAGKQDAGERDADTGTAGPAVRGGAGARGDGAGELPAPAGDGERRQTEQDGLKEESETPAQTFASIDRQRHEFEKHLHGQAEGATFKLPHGTGTSGGIWKKTNVAGDPFWKNIETGEYRSSGDNAFHAHEGKIREALGKEAHGNAPTDMPKSKGHVAFVGKSEYYRGSDGKLYKAGIGGKVNAKNGSRNGNLTTDAAMQADQAKASSVPRSTKPSPAEKAEIEAAAAHPDVQEAIKNVAGTPEGDDRMEAVGELPDDVRAAAAAKLEKDAALLKPIEPAEAVAEPAEVSATPPVENLAESTPEQWQATMETARQEKAAKAKPTEPAANKMKDTSTYPERIRAWAVTQYHPKYVAKATQDLLDVATGNREGNTFEQATIAKIFPELDEVDHDDLAAESGGSDRAGLPAGEPLGGDAEPAPATVLPGPGEGTGEQPGSVHEDRDLRRDDAGVDAGGRGDAEQHRGGVGAGPAPADAAGGPGEGDAVGAGGEPGRSGADDATASGDLASPREQSLNEPATRDNPTDLAAGNFRYGGPIEFAGKGLKTKFKQNIDAIKTLRAISIDGRAIATPAEQEVMAKFVGWGQFPAIFKEHGDEGYSRAEKMAWQKEAEILRSLLSDDEWRKARGSTLNAHYTHPDVVAAHWKMAERLGFKGGRFLETSAGIGYYLGMMPPELAKSTRSSAVELDTVTGQMLKMLYPSARTEVQGFEEFQSPDNFYDLIASNVPFGDYSVHDKRYNKHQANIHDYFFLKSADLCAPGGLVMHITSTGTMDKGDSKIRALLAKKFDLVSAIRFPGSTHKENAGTEVVTDMLILRKRAPGEKPSGPNWLDTVEVPCPTSVSNPNGGAPIRVNQYFAEHPEQILGRLDRTGTMYAGDEMNVTAGDDYEQRLAEAIERLPQNIMAKPVQSEAFKAEPLPAPGDVRPGGYAIKGSQLYRSEAGLLQPIESKPKTLERIKGHMAIRDAVRDVINEQRSGNDATPARAKLNEVYDAYVKKFGFLNERGNKLAFRGDPDAPLVRALEKWDNDSKSATKSDMFSRDTIKRVESVTHADTVSDALAASLHEYGKIDIDHMAQLLGKDAAHVKAGMVAEGVAFEDPADGFQPADQYLSGNVRLKLVLARAAAASDPKFQINVAALEKVQPEDIDHTEITARLGANWIPGSDVAEFAAHLLNAQPEHFDIKHVAETGEWVAHYTNEGARRLRDSAAANSVWGVEMEMPNGAKRQVAGFLDILRSTLAGKSMVIKKTVTGDNGDPKEVVDQEATDACRAKSQEMKEAFAGENGDGWLWEDDARRARLHRHYNDNFNNIRHMEYNGSHLKFPGMNPSIKLHPHIPNFVWQVITTGTGLAGHEVGTGKAQPLDAKLLTPRGWVTMGDARVGDEVIAGDGSRTTITGVFPQGEKDIFRVLFSDGSSTECCAEHLWLTQTYHERNYAIAAKHAEKTDWTCDKPKVRSLAEIAETLIDPRLGGVKNHSIPIVGTVDFAHAPVPVEPYLLGVLLGDGSLSTRSVRITTDRKDIEIIENIERSLPNDLMLREHQSAGLRQMVGMSGDTATLTRNGCPTWGIVRKIAGRTSHSLVTSLDKMGLMGRRSHDKFIPDLYKFNQAPVRIAVLQGLLDTDGTISKRKERSVTYYTVSDKLADDVAFLVQSLGGIVRRSMKYPSYVYGGEKKQGKPCHVLCLSLPPEIMPFRLKRKADLVVPKTKYRPARYIVGVEPVGKKQAQCIAVAHPSHLYVTDDFIVTHNTYTQIASAMELRRLGLAKKPCIACLKANVEAITADVLHLYPGAKVLSTSDMFTADKRKQTIAQIATGDYDVIVMTHDNLNMLQMTPETTQKYIQEELDELRAAKSAAEKESGGKKGSKSHSVKALEKAEKNLEAKLKEATDATRKDDAVYFEDLGIDQIFVDECFPGKTIVMTEQGPLTIAEVVDNRMEVRVLSCNRETGQMEWKPVTAWFNRPLRNHLVRVTHEHGSFICTPNHQIWTAQGYVDAARLRGSHIVALMERPISRKTVGGTSLMAELDSLVINVEVHQQANDANGECVYDIEVEGNHNYFADGVNVSNSHKYKTLPVYTRKNRVKGVPSGRSQRATNMLMRTRWLQEQNGGRGVVFATGTPISNTMAEMYTMQRYLQPQALKDRGIDKFDDWANVFGEEVTKVEVSVAGEYKPTTRFSKFVNVPELMQIARQVIDVRRADDIRKGPADVPEEARPTEANFTGETRDKTGKAYAWTNGTTSAIRRPKRKDHVVVAPYSEAIAGLMGSLKDRADEIKKRSGPPQKGDDNMLVICTDGRKGALDMRLVDPSAPDDPESKTNQAIRNILQIAQERPGQVQLIFSDVGVNPMKIKGGESAALGNKKDEDEDLDAEADEDSPDDAVGMRWYGDVIDKLVAGGIPREKIADFSELKGQAKEDAQAALRRGDMVIGIGSTEKMGTGVNIQNKIVAMHHLDVPWVPAAIEQRDGRGWRHGNENDQVDIYRYVTEGSLDQMFWQVVGTKAAFIKEVMTPANVAQRTVENMDTEQLSPEELAAAASGDPRMLVKVNLESEVKQLRRSQARHDKEQAKLKRAEAETLEKIKTTTAVAGEKTKDAEQLKSNPDFRFEIGDVAHTERKEAEPAFEAAKLEAEAKMERLTATNPYAHHHNRQTIGQYRGMDVVRKGPAGAGRIYLETGTEQEYLTSGSLQGIESMARQIENRYPDEAAKDVQQAENDLVKIRANIGKPFTKAGELQQKAEQLKALEDQLYKEKPEEEKAPPAEKPKRYYQPGGIDVGSFHVHRDGKEWQVKHGLTGFNATGPAKTKALAMLAAKALDAKGDWNFTNAEQMGEETRAHGQAVGRALQGSNRTGFTHLLEGLARATSQEATQEASARNELVAEVSSLRGKSAEELAKYSTDELREMIANAREEEPVALSANLFDISDDVREEALRNLRELFPLSEYADEDAALSAAEPPAPPVRPAPKTAQQLYDEYRTALEKALS